MSGGLHLAVGSAAVRTSGHDTVSGASRATASAAPVRRSGHARGDGPSPGPRLGNAAPPRAARPAPEERGVARGFRVHARPAWSRPWPAAVVHVRTGATRPAAAAAAPSIFLLVLGATVASTRDRHHEPTQG